MIILQNLSVEQHHTCPSLRHRCGLYEIDAHGNQCQSTKVEYIIANDVVGLMLAMSEITSAQYQVRNQEGESTYKHDVQGRHLKLIHEGQASCHQSHGSHQTTIDDYRLFEMTETKANAVTAASKDATKEHAQTKWPNHIEWLGRIAVEGNHANEVKDMCHAKADESCDGIGFLAHFRKILQCQPHVTQEPHNHSRLHEEEIAMIWTQYICFRQCRIHGHNRKGEDA